MQINKVEETSERLLIALKAEKEELEATVTKEKMQALQLKQELTDAESRNTELYKVPKLHYLFISMSSIILSMRRDGFYFGVHLKLPTRGKNTSPNRI